MSCLVLLGRTATLSKKFLIDLFSFFQILLIFMQRMEMLLSKTPPTDVKNDVLPMIYRNRRDVFGRSRF
jgi:hypothetical protein